MLYCNVSVKVLDVIGGTQYIKLICKQHISEDSVSDIIDMVQKIISKSRNNLVLCNHDDLVEGSVVLLNMPVYEGVTPIWTRGQIIGRSDLSDHVRVLLCDFGSINYEVPVYHLFKFVHAIPTLQTQFELCYLADATPVAATGFSKPCIDFTKNLILNKQVTGNAWRERGKVTLFRPTVPKQNRLVTDALAANNYIRLVNFFPQSQTKSISLSGKLPKKQLVGSSSGPEQKSVDGSSQCNKVKANSMHNQNEVKRRLVEESSKGMNEETLRTVVTYKELAQDGHYLCKVTNVEEGPWKFTLILHSPDEQLEERLANVHVEKERVLQLGKLVLCEKAGKVCRGLIESVEPLHCKIFLIDSGIYDTFELSNVYVMPPSLASIPAQAIKCQLQGLPKTVNHTISGLFEKIVEEKSLDLVSGKCMADKMHRVYLELNGMSVSKLCCLNIYDHSSLVSGSNVTVNFVDEINNILYLQMTDRCQLLRLISDTTNQVSTATLTKAFVGQPCLLQQNCTNSRALVLKVQEESYKVLLVDYGNEVITPMGDLKEISPYLVAMAPTQAIPCILPNTCGSKLDALQISRWTKRRECVADVIGYANILINGVKRQVQKVVIKDAANSKSILNSSPEDEQSSMMKAKEALKSVCMEHQPTIVQDTLKSCVIKSWNSSNDFVVNLYNKKHPNAIEDYLNRVILERVVGEVEEGQYYVYETSAGLKRARMLKVSSSNIEMEFIDFGTFATGLKDRVFMCAEEIGVDKVRAQSIRCSLSDDDDLDDIDIPVHLANQELKIHFVEKYAGKWKVEILRVSNLLKTPQDNESHTLMSVCDESFFQQNSRESLAPVRRISKEKFPPQVPLEVFDVISLCHFDGDYIWLQKEKGRNELNYVISIIRDIPKEVDLEATQTSIVNWSVGDACIAQSTDNDTWRRALIVELRDDEALVLKVDYGEKDWVSFYKIIKIANELLPIGPLAYKCQIVSSVTINDSTWNKYQVDNIFNYDQDTRTYEISVKVHDTVAWIPCISETSYGFPVVDVTLNIECQVVVAQIHTNGLLTVHLPEHIDHLRQMTEQIRECIDNIDALPSAKIGSLCLAFHSKEKTWHRAAISLLSEDSVTINYLDYGSSEEQFAKSLKVLPEHWRLLAAQAIICGIYNTDTKMVVDANRLIESQELFGHIVTGTFTKVGEGLVLKEVSVDGCPLVALDSEKTLEGEVEEEEEEEEEEEQEEEEDAKNLSCMFSVESRPKEMEELPPADFPEDQKVTLKIVHVEDAEVVWMQKVDSIVTSINAECREAVVSEKSLLVENPVIGCHYVASSSDNCDWCRCRLLERFENGQKVLYVDYGAVGVADAVYSTTCELLRTPAQAIRCDLSPRLNITNPVDVCGHQVTGTLEKTYDNYFLVDWFLVDYDHESPQQISDALCGRSREQCISIDSWFEERHKIKQDSHKDANICKILVEELPSTAHSSPSQERTRSYSRSPSISDTEWQSECKAPLSKQSSTDASSASLNSLPHISDNTTSLENSASYPTSSSHKQYKNLANDNKSLVATKANGKESTRTSSSNPSCRDVSDILKELSLSAQRAIGKLSISDLSTHNVAITERRELLEKLNSLVSLANPLVKQKCKQLKDDTSHKSTSDVKKNS